MLRIICIFGFVALLSGPVFAACEDGLVEVDGACVVPSEHEPEGPEPNPEPEQPETIYDTGPASVPSIDHGYANGMSGGPPESRGWSQ